MSSSHPDIQSYPLTTVIATLGGSSLLGTVEALNRGTIIPEEILICIPANEAHKVANFYFPNVKIITTDKRGQVFQRSVGFKHAAHDVVMQLDDDVYVDTHCIEHLLETLTAQGPKVAVGSSNLLRNGESAYKRDENNKSLDFYYWLINGKAGYAPGTISLSGAAFGLDLKVKDKRIYNVEWLSGGCLICNRENRVLEDFYPFRGHAYNEDLIHSFLLKDQGCKLVVDSEARCYWDKGIPSSSFGPSEFVKNLVADYRARKYFVKLSSRSFLRMNLHFIVWALSYFGKIFIQWIRKFTW